jgi:hypothetical protein
MHYTPLQLLLLLLLLLLQRDLLGHSHDPVNLTSYLTALPATLPAPTTPPPPTTPHRNVTRLPLQ